MFVRARFIAPFSALACFLLGASCERPAAPVVLPIGTVFVDRDSSREFDLRPFVSGARSASVQETAEIEVIAEGLLLTLTPRPGFTGGLNLALTVHGGGKQASGTLPVRVKDGTRRCETVFRYRGAGSSVHLAGSFNGFSATAAPMAETGGPGSGEWELAVVLQPGDWAYKFVVDGEYRLDEENPLTMFVGGIENSRVDVGDCAIPRLDLFDVAVSGSSGTFSAAVAFVSASDGEPPSGPPAASLGGQPLEGDWDAQTRVLSLAGEGIPGGKHLLTVTASDTAGRVPEKRSVPFWIDGQAPGEGPFDWRDSVAYFVFTDRFRNGEPGNDAPEPGVLAPANYQGGDWQGLEAAIEEGYFDDLGVNVLWISPQIDNPSGGWQGADGRDYTGYHGYWPAQARVAEERFGGMEALQSAVDAAHARGIRVILDVVLNHVHQEHAWWIDQPGAPWFHDLYVCGYEKPIECWFTDYLPDVDFQHLDALKASIDDAVWWVEQTGADGFRVDAVKHFEHVVTRTLRDQARRRFEIGGSQFWMVGETFVGRWSDPGQAETIRNYVSDRELDGQYDFPLYWEIVRTVGREEGTLRDLEKVLRESEGFYGEEAIMGTFVGNHDVPRFASHANGDIADLFGGGSQEQGWTSPPDQPTTAAPYARLRSAFTLLFSLPGVPTIYYGDEIGLAGAGDPDNRRMMPWSGLSTEQLATRAHVSSLAKARRAHPELSRGAVKQVFMENELLILQRSHAGRHAYVVLHRGPTARVIDVAVDAPDGTTFTDLIGGGSATVQAGILEIEVPAAGSALYLQS